MPNVIVIFKTWSACLIYSIIIGDLFNDLAITAGISSIGGIAVTRTSIIVASHVFGLLPLCLLRSFSWLSYASLLGVGGILFTAGFMVLRLLEGSYLPGGEFFQALTAAGAAAAPVVVSSFDVKGTSLLKSIILVSTLTSSYLCHYNSPKFLKELKDATPNRCRPAVVAPANGHVGPGTDTRAAARISARSVTRCAPLQVRPADLLVLPRRLRPQRRLHGLGLPALRRRLQGEPPSRVCPSRTRNPPRFAWLRRRRH